MPDLSMFDDAYASATPPEKQSQHDSVPDGKYQAEIEKFELVETQKNKTPMLKITLRIIAGEHSPRCVFKNSVIQSNTLDFVKRDLMTLGYSGKISELNDPSVRMGFVGKKLEIGLKTKDCDEQGRPNQNIYLNKLLGDVMAGSHRPAAKAGGAAMNDEPPF